MLSYASIPLHLPAPEEAALIASRIPIADAFAFPRPRCLGDPELDPRRHCNWALARPFKLNSLFMPWGASRWGYAFVVADGDMHDAILAQAPTGDEQLPFTMDDGLGNFITTPMLMLPPIPLTKILTPPTYPSLPLFLMPLVDERYRFFECADLAVVLEGTTTWAELYADIATALGISLAVDPISPAYLMPSAGLTRRYQPLPLLLDLVASSVGQRFVRELDGSFYARGSVFGTAMMVAQANQYAKYAGGSLDLGVINA